MFMYLIFSVLGGNPCTHPRQQVITQGPSEPEVALEAAVIPAQQVGEFPELCFASGGSDGPRNDRVWISEWAFYTRYKATTLGV